MARTVDPIKAEVVARHLLATSEEMSASLMRTACSPNIKERADSSTVIFDAQGQVIALAQRVPVPLARWSARWLPSASAIVWMTSIPVLGRLVTSPVTGYT
jgi:N-methylhydantoinase B/oxoprolinase/acetone carboxylase alpha subunit